MNEEQSHTEEPNPALAPTEVEAGSKQYRVVGEHAVFGHEKGEVFPMALSHSQEEYYLKGGHLEVVTEAQTDVKGESEV